MQHLYASKGIKPEDIKKAPVRKLINELNRNISSAIDVGVADAAIKYEVPELLLNALQQNAYIFSGFKAYHELKEASTLLVTEDGKIKPFNTFKEDVLKIHEAYNLNYLEAEYNFAVQSAQMATKWSDYEKDGDDYYLQYRTAGDEKVRVQHEELNGTTLPASDPFWDDYMPPLDWNCRCTVVQVLKDKFQKSDSAAAVKKGEKATTRISAEGVNKAAMFRFNPGKTMTLFPEKHPYFPRGCADCDLKVKLAADIPQNELCKVCKEIIELAQKEVYAPVIIKDYENGGKIYASGLVDAKAPDFDKIFENCQSFAKQGEITEILPKINSKDPKYAQVYHTLIGTPYEGKCPDFKVGNTFYEHEGFKTKVPKNAFRNMLNNGLKQSSRVVIEDCGLTDGYMNRVIQGRLADKQKIDEIYVNKNSVLRRIYPIKAE